MRLGIKVALSGVLALYVALWMRLDHPTWAIFTVLVVSLPQFVGAVAEKATLRVIGTTIGGLFGVYLIGNFVDSPAILFPVSFVWIAFCSAMFFGGFYPYAFLLAALTFVVVFSDAMLEPNSAWQVSKARILEIIVGNIAVVIVSSILWPRYAVDEFLQNLKEGLIECADLMQVTPGIFAGKKEAAERAEAITLEFQSRLNLLRQLVYFGARESRPLRRRLTSYQAAIDELDAIFLGARNLATLANGAGEALPLVEKELESAFTSLTGSLHRISEEQGDAQRNPDPPSEQDVVTAIETKLEAARADGSLANYQAETVAALSGILFTLGILTERLERLSRLLLDDQQISREKPPKAYANPMFPPVPALLSGIKAGFGTLLGLIYCNWVDHPGSAMVPLVMWVSLVMTRGFYGGEGDRRAFQLAAGVVFFGIPATLAVFLITPFLANYLVMNLVVIGFLFWFGYWAASIVGVSWGLQVLILVSASVVALNAQVPVSPEQILSTYLALSTGYLLAAIIQRLLWPSLPQREVRDLLAEFFESCDDLLPRQPGEEAPLLRMRITLIPTELTKWIAKLDTPDVPKGEQDRLLALVDAMRNLGFHLRVRRKPVADRLSSELQDDFRKIAHTLEASYHTAVRAYAAAFRRGEAPKPCEELRKAQASFVEAVTDLRKRQILASKDLDETVHFLGRLYSYNAIGSALLACGEKSAALQLDAYMGDNIL